MHLFYAYAIGMMTQRVFISQFLTAAKYPISQKSMPKKACKISTHQNAKKHAFVLLPLDKKKNTLSQLLAQFLTFWPTFPTNAILTQLLALTFFWCSLSYLLKFWCINSALGARSHSFSTFLCSECTNLEHTPAVVMKHV